MTDNMEYWSKLKQPPKSALKTIQAGRLKGKSDINPQWRYQAMTEIFGPCGIGWKYTIDQVWREEADSGQVFAFAKVSVYISGDDSRWSDPIPGIGGSMLVTNESKGIHSSDEGYKMAVTDALSVALKMLGVAADVYAGKFDGSKYAQDEKPTQEEALGVEPETNGLDVPQTIPCPRGKGPSVTKEFCDNGECPRETRCQNYREAWGKL